MLRRSSWKSGHKADREEILKLLCRGGSEIRVRVPISVEALKCMQESKLFECRPQELDEKFVTEPLERMKLFTRLLHAHPYEFFTGKRC